MSHHGSNAHNALVTCVHVLDAWDRNWRPAVEDTRAASSADS
jgi:hypothetical protein